LQVSAIGNHDLDGGPGTFAGIIQSDTNGWAGAQFPWLSTNLDFSTDSAVSGLIGENGVEASQQPGKLASSAVITVAGEKIGFVGAVTPTLASITSTGNIGIAPANNDLDALAAEIQPAVDALSAQGINKIVLLAHMQQISVEKGLATRLSKVDVIVAGGSNTLLADGNDALHPGDVAADNYPLLFSSPQQEPVLVVNVDGDYKYLGRLVVDFDEQGRILTSLLDPALNGAWASLSAVATTLSAEPIAAVTSVANTLKSVLSSKDGNVAGFTTVYLEGRRSGVRAEETNLGNLTADANLWYARQAEPEVTISLKNGGGIRAAIGQIIAPPGSTDASAVTLLPPQANSFKAEGGVSQLDIETSLAFNNRLSMITVTAAELRDIMEHAVAGANPGATPGSFPQIGGMRFSFDSSRTARSGDDSNQATSSTGQRLRSLVVTLPGGSEDVIVADGTLLGDSQRTFRLVTLNFLVSCVADTSGAAADSCGDGYPFKGLANPARKDLEVDFSAAAYDPGKSSFAGAGSEQDALAEYLSEFHGSANAAFSAAETSAEQDTRIIRVQ
jgi:2',3'-cyclic-nucleotide 2'-phosphodiesterase (5'-nucleotidase family)